MIFSCGIGNESYVVIVSLLIRNETTMKNILLILLTITLISASGCYSTQTADSFDSEPDSGSDADTDADTDADSDQTIKVVFIGNSLTYVNDLPKVLVNLGKSANPPVVFDISDKYLQGAASLGYLWHPVISPPNPVLISKIVQGTIKMISEADADFVVLQDQSSGPDLTGVIPELWHGLIHPTGAKTVMFMTWGIGENITESGAILQNKYNNIAEFLGVNVAPVGSAWLRHYGKSDVSLHSSDGTHPAPAGTYLSALVFYATLTGRDPRELSTGGLSIDEVLAESLRQIAWETYKDSPLADVSTQNTSLPKDDHGNTLDKATPYTFGESLDGVLGPSDVDFFKFTIPADGRIEISISSTDKSMYAHIMDPGGKIIGRAIYPAKQTYIDKSSFTDFGNDPVLKSGDEYFLRITGGVEIKHGGEINNTIFSEYTITSKLLTGADPLDCNGGRLDKDTGLCWQDPVSPFIVVTWQEAADYCNTLSLAGHTDWRLPTLNELTDLLSNCDGNVTSEKEGSCDSCENSAKCNALMAPSYESYWTSSPAAGDSDSAWSVNLNAGFVKHYKKEESFHCNHRCVRNEP